MDDALKKAAGAAAAVAALALGALGTPGPLFLCLPYLCAAPFWAADASFGTAFGVITLAGLLASIPWPQLFGTSWALVGFLSLPAILWVPRTFERRDREELAEFGADHSEKKIELDALRLEGEKIKQENARIEARLRQIGQLYDVIKEAGGALNVQEMIELTRDFTERMFQLRHFIIAVLSEDGKRFEVRVASGCDESLFRDPDGGIGPDSLISAMIKGKKPVWVSPGGGGPGNPLLGGLPAKSFVFVPFLVQERLIGFLCSYSLGDDFLDRETFAALQVFCNQISICLQKSQLYEKVQKLSITDGLTKLHTHRYFKQRLEEEWVLAKRHSSPLSLLMLDIDHFKRYNDTYGHVAGDRVLREVALILREGTDVTHLAARYGGEEMVLVASETDKGKAVELAERIRKAVAEHPFAAGGEATPVTVSIGVAAYPQDALGNIELIGKADKALYAAKELGRNRVAAFEG